MNTTDKDMKDRIAYVALFYAIKGQVKKSEELRRLIRKMQRPEPVLVG